VKDRIQNVLLHLLKQSICTITDIRFKIKHKFLIRNAKKEIFSMKKSDLEMVEIIYGVDSAKSIWANDSFSENTFRPHPHFASSPSVQKAFRWFATIPLFMLLGWSFYVSISSSYLFFFIRFKWKKKRSFKRNVLLWTRFFFIEQFLTVCYLWWKFSSRAMPSL
jgi:hypothetical protein